MEQLSISRLLALTFTLAVFTGCGNFTRSDYQKAPASAYGNISNESRSTTGNWNTDVGSQNNGCPTAANILQSSHWNADTGSYKACSIGETPNQVVLSGTPRFAGNVCVIAIRRVNENEVYPVGSQCITASDSGVSLTFDQADFNALAVVHPQDRTQMISCLNLMNKGLCPRNSYGTFR